MQRPILALLTITLALLTAVAHESPSLAQGGGSPLVRGEHPRLFINTDTWPEIAAVLGTGGAYASEFQAWVNWLDSRYASTQGKNPEEWAINFAFAGLAAGGRPGLAPVAGTRFAYTAQQYTTRALEYFRTYRGNSNMPPQGSPNAMHAAVIYDWLHHALPADERAAFGAWLASNDLDDSGVNAWADSGDVINRAARLMRGIAISGDGINDAWASAAVAKWTPWFRSSNQGVAAINSLYGGDDGGFAQGYFYGAAYTIWPLMLVEEGYRTALGIPRGVHYASTATNVLRNLPKYYNDMVVDAFPRTYDGSLPADGYQWWLYNSELVYYTPDSARRHSAPPAGMWMAGQFMSSVPSAADPAMASLGKWFMRRRMGDEPSRFYQSAWIWGRAIFGRWAPGVQEADPGQLGLPLSKGRADGLWVFRSGWTNDIDYPTVMLMAARWVPQDYGFRHTGAFHVYRKGPQIHRGYSTDGHHNKTGISGSIMAFVPRGLSTVPTNGQYHNTDYWMVGAERTVGMAPDYGSVAGTTHEGARTLGAWLSDGSSQRDVDYVALDLTRLYSSTLFAGTGGPRISNYVRRFVYFRPANPKTDSVRLVVYDRPTVLDPYDWERRTGTNSKTWMLWTAGEPSFVGGSVLAGPSRGPTGTHGKWYSDDAVSVTATNTANGADGRVWLTPVLPLARRIIKVGGPSVTGQSWSYGGTDPTQYSHEFETPTGYVWKAGTYGVDAAKGNAYPEFTPPYHIEVEDRGRNATEVFVNVVEVGDSAAAQSPVQRVAGVKFVGARVGQRIAVFSEFTDQEVEGSFVLPATGTFRVLISGLLPSAEFEVSWGGAATRLLSTDAGTIYTSGSGSAGMSISLKATGYRGPSAPGNLRQVVQ